MRSPGRACMTQSVCEAPHKCVECAEPVSIHPSPGLLAAYSASQSGVFLAQCSAALHAPRRKAQAGSQRRSRSLGMPRGRTNFSVTPLHAALRDFLQPHSIVFCGPPPLSAAPLLRPSTSSSTRSGVPSVPRTSLSRKGGSRRGPELRQPPNNARD